LPIGEAPAVDPTNPAVLLSDDIKRRIEENIARQQNPVDEGHDW
jgi:hypothetical protein